MSLSLENEESLAWIKNVGDPVAALEVLRPLLRSMGSDWASGLRALGFTAKPKPAFQLMFWTLKDFTPDRNSRKELAARLKLSKPAYTLLVDRFGGVYTRTPAEKAIVQDFSKTWERPFPIGTPGDAYEVYYRPVFTLGNIVTMLDEHHMELRQDGRWAEANLKRSSERVEKMRGDYSRINDLELAGWGIRTGSLIDKVAAKHLR